MAYDAFGVVTNRTGSTNTQKGFVGEEGYQEDNESGYKLLGHRYYDPETGRFLTRDPIGDGRNWYGYCANNPLKAVDPNGLKEGDLFGSAEAAAKDAADTYAAKSRTEDGGHEYGGYIYRVKDPKTGKFMYSYTAMRGSGMQMKFSKSDFTFPDGAEIVGNWHTHGKYVPQMNVEDRRRLSDQPSPGDYGNWYKNYILYGWDTFSHVDSAGQLSMYYIMEVDGYIVFVRIPVHQYWIVNYDGSGFEWVSWDLRRRKKGKK